MSTMGSPNEIGRSGELLTPRSVLEEDG